jgi:hypothetical protein
VRLGATQLDVTESGSLTFLSTVGIVHHEYNEITLADDVAFIQLPSEVLFNGENCYILINVKFIFLTHRSGCLHFLLHRTL